MATTSSDAGWTVVDFERVRGEYPIRAFLAGLDGRNANEATMLLEQLAARGNTFREPRSAPVDRNLFELRGHQVRIFYGFRPGRMIVLLDGVIKKQDKMPRDVLERVRSYRDEVERRGPRVP